MEADRGRTPDSTPDRDLRRDIRRVTSILGETLARTEGDDLLALVEQVRAHAKEDRLDELPDFDLATITRLVRAFTAYFHLANITEQVHRGRALTRASAEEGGWLERAGRPDRRRPAIDPDEVASSCSSRSPCAPSSPPTRPRSPGARPSTSCVAVAALLEEPDNPRRTRRLEEAVELLWLTDEIRVEPPEPTDEARNVVYYLEGLVGRRPARRARGAARPAACRSASTCRPTCARSASAPGSAATATATPTSPRDHARGARRSRRCTASGCSRSLVDRLRRDLSVSDHVSSVSDEI